MKRYELYVCGHMCGCKTLIIFEADGDSSATERARKLVNNYELDTGDYIYREYLYRNEPDGTQVELVI